MDKSWREILIDAKARGSLTVAERARWLNAQTCPAAELCARYGLSMLRALDLWSFGTLAFVFARAGRFDLADQVLDLMDDRALALKRELT